MPPQAADAVHVLSDSALATGKAEQHRQLMLRFASDDRQTPPSVELVIGNPPYGALMSAKETALYRDHYELARAKFDVVSLFIEIAGNALEQDGVMAYVLPHAFTRSGGYEATRQWLLERGSLAALINMGSGFPEIELNTCAMVWRKGVARGEVAGYEARAGELVRVGQVASSFYQGRRAWPIYVSGENVELAQHLEAEGAAPLESLVRIHRGPTIKGLAKLMRQTEPGDGTPVVRGRNVQRYADLAEMPLGCVRDEDMPEHALRGVLAGRAVVIQNIGDRVKATLCPKGMLPIDTVNVLDCHDPAIACYLVAYLNSSLVDRYVRDMILNRATLTVHFDSPTIGALPVRVPDPIELEYYDRVVPMLIEEADSEMQEEVEARIREQYGLASPL